MAAIDIDKLLEDIHPLRTIEQVAESVDEAINTFQYGSGIVSQWKEFNLILSRFASHVQNLVLGIPRGVRA